MADITVDIGSSFEMLSKEEWDNYLDTKLFDNIRIDLNKFKDYEKFIFMYPRLAEALNAHNNKVGDLIVTYALCKHYFDNGIPDNPWYISPGKEGQSIQYFPEFSEEHWMRRYWFNHYAENLYLKYFSLWDGVLGILNIFYGIDESLQDYRFRSNVMNALKAEHKSVNDFMGVILKEPIYKEANEYRTSFVHGIAPSVVSDGYIFERDKMTEIFEIGDDGKTYKKPVKAAAIMTCSVGRYTLVETVMNNIEAFADFSGSKIQELVSLILEK